MMSWIRASLLGLLTLAAFAATAREGVEVPPPSIASSLVSAEQVERSATQQYAQLIAQASAKHALAPPTHPQLVRLRAIADGADVRLWEDATAGAVVRVLDGDERRAR